MKKYLSLVKFAHTIFALPFALMGLYLGFLYSGQGFTLRLFVLVLLCMVFARSAAMAFNRYLDRDIDAVNPRTATREIPDGKISPQNALLFAALNSTLFILTTWFINFLCFALSPIALLVILGYSYTKRFTPLCHFVLGTGLALAPVGAFLAVTGAFHWLPIIYGIVVLLWVSGFDIIYALQDESFDKTNNLFSIPGWLGAKNALILSSFAHVMAALFLLSATYTANSLFPSLSYFHWLGTIIFISLLFYQHTIVSPTNLSKVNQAFFTTNGMASLILGSLFIIDYYF